MAKSVTEPCDESTRISTFDALLECYHNGTTKGHIVKLTTLDPLKSENLILLRVDTNGKCTKRSSSEVQILEKNISVDPIKS